MKSVLTSSDRLPRTALGRSERLGLLALLLGTGACNADALVYGSEPLAATAAGRGGAGASGGSAGSAEEAGSGGEGVYGCGGTGAGGGRAIVTDILSGPGGVGDWLQNDLACTTDTDCAKTLFTPRCNPQTSLCGQCADVARNVELYMDVIGCLASARTRCCNDPGSPVDCVLRDCVMRCDEGR